MVQMVDAVSSNIFSLSSNASQAMATKRAARALPRKQSTVSNSAINVDPTLQRQIGQLGIALDSYKDKMSTLDRGVSGVRSMRSLLLSAKSAILAAKTNRTAVTAQTTTAQTPNTVGITRTIAVNNTKTQIANVQQRFENTVTINKTKTVSYKNDITGSQSFTPSSAMIGSDKQKKFSISINGKTSEFTIKGYQETWNNGQRTVTQGTTLNDLVSAINADANVGGTNNANGVTASIKNGKLNLTSTSSSDIKLQDTATSTTWDTNAYWLDGALNTLGITTGSGLTTASYSARATVTDNADTSSATGFIRAADGTTTYTPVDGIKTTTTTTETGTANGYEQTNVVSSSYLETDTINDRYERTTTIVNSQTATYSNTLQGTANVDASDAIASKSSITNWNTSAKFTIGINGKSAEFRLTTTNDAEDNTTYEALINAINSNASIGINANPTSGVRASIKDGRFTLESASSSDLTLADTRGQVLQALGFKTGANIAKVTISDAAPATTTTDWAKVSSSDKIEGAAVLQGTPETVTTYQTIGTVTTSGTTASTNPIDLASLQNTLNSYFAQIDSASFGGANGAFNVLRGSDVKLATPRLNGKDEGMTFSGLNLSRGALELNDITSLTEKDLDAVLKKLDAADQKLATAEATLTGFQSITTAQNSAISDMLNLSKDALDSKKASALSRTIGNQIDSRSSISGKSGAASLRSLLGH